MIESPVVATKCKRRWFQFSLRSLTIGVTLLAPVSAYVARQHAFVHDRQQFLEDGPTGYDTSDEASGIPWIRRLLGDQAIGEIRLQPETDKAERQRVAALFPEAEIIAVRIMHVPHGSHEVYFSKQVPFSDEPAHSGDEGELISRK
jgi:hypothetical protein